METTDSNTIQELTERIEGLEHQVEALDHMLHLALSKLNIPHGKLAEFGGIYRGFGPPEQFESIVGKKYRPNDASAPKV